MYKLHVICKNITDLQSNVFIIILRGCKKSHFNRIHFFSCVCENVRSLVIVKFYVPFQLKRLFGDGYALQNLSMTEQTINDDNRRMSRTDKSICNRCFRLWTKQKISSLAHESMLSIYAMSFLVRQLAWAGIYTRFFRRNPSVSVSIF